LVGIYENWCSEQLAYARSRSARQPAPTVQHLRAALVNHARFRTAARAQIHSNYIAIKNW